MERNQLRKQTEEARQKAEEAERKDLENKEEFRQLYEREQQKREEYEQKLRDMEQQREHRELRDSVLSEYPDEVRQLADDLGVQLDTSQDEETAKSEYKSKLDKLHERVQGGQQQQQNNEISVDANNPAPAQGQQKTKDDLIREAQQTGDWSEVLSTIPSVQQQIGQEGDQKQ